MQIAIVKLRSAATDLENLINDKPYMDKKTLIRQARRSIREAYAEVSKVAKAFKDK